MHERRKRARKSDVGRNPFFAPRAGVAAAADSAATFIANGAEPAFQALVGKAADDRAAPAAASPAVRPRYGCPLFKCLISLELRKP